MPHKFFKYIINTCLKLQYILDAEIAAHEPRVKQVSFLSSLDKSFL